MSDVHLVLMENILRFKEPKNLEHVFDLKGSLVDRIVKGKLKPSTTLKDVNFIRETQKYENFTRFGCNDRRMLIRALRKDVAFLCANGIMDYSLLLGIEKTKPSLNTDILHCIGAPRYSVSRQIWNNFTKTNRSSLLPKFNRWTQNLSQPK